VPLRFPLRVFITRGGGIHRKIEVWTMGERQGIKVLISVIGLDGHSTGAEVVCRILMDAGMEVVYLGIYQTPEMIVRAAIQEDVDVIGISSHASNYGQIVELLELLKKNNLGDIRVICGGTIPQHQMQELKKTGVSEIFLPQSTSESIVEYIVQNVKRARPPSSPTLTP
jgi:methylmalonyl-CoA mutase, C-terminal domain